MKSTTKPSIQRLQFFTSSKEDTEWLFARRNCGRVGQVYCDYHDWVFLQLECAMRRRLKLEEEIKEALKVYESLGAGDALERLAALKTYYADVKVKYGVTNGHYDSARRNEANEIYLQVSRLVETVCWGAQLVGAIETRIMRAKRRLHDPSRVPRVKTMIRQYIVILQEICSLARMQATSARQTKAHNDKVTKHILQSCQPTQSITTTTRNPRTRHPKSTSANAASAPSSGSPAAGSARTACEKTKSTASGDGAKPCGG